MKNIEAMAAEYEDSVKTQFNWAVVKARALANANSKDASVEDGRAEGLAYLGSILNISPSGKFYVPFACSNVMGCEACDGQGIVDKPRRSRYRRVKSYERLKRIEQRLFSAWKKQYGYFCDWPASQKTKITATRKRLCALEQTTSCIYCSEMGSREAALDVVWREALEAEASKHGLYITGSEGDGCDVCAGITVTLPDDEDVSNDTLVAADG